MGTTHLDIHAFTTLPQIEEGAQDVVTVNFLVDGVTAFGKVWYRGEELSVQRNSPWWEATVDRGGVSWLDLSEAEQRAIYGEVRFAHGTWTGGGFDLDDDALEESDREVLAKIEAAKQQPVLPQPKARRKRTTRST